MSQIALIEQHALIESILEPYRAALGASLYRGYRSHAYRMLNFGRALAASEPDHDERLAVAMATAAAAFERLPPPRRAATRPRCKPRMRRSARASGSSTTAWRCNGR